MTTRPTSVSDRGLGRALGGVLAEYDAAEQPAIVSYPERMIDVLRRQTIRLGADATP